MLPDQQSKRLFVFSLYGICHFPLQFISIDPPVLYIRFFFLHRSDPSPVTFLSPLISISPSSTRFPLSIRRDKESTLDMTPMGVINTSMAQSIRVGRKESANIEAMLSLEVCTTTKSCIVVQLLAVSLGCYPSCSISALDTLTHMTPT